MRCLTEFLNSLPRKLFNCRTIQTIKTSVFFCFICFALCYHCLLSASHCTIVTSDVKESGMPLANPYHTALLSNYKPIHQQPNSLERKGRVCTHTRTHTDSWKTSDKIKLKSTTLKDPEPLIFIADTDTNILWGFELSV